MRRALLIVAVLTLGFGLPASMARAAEPSPSCGAKGLPDCPLQSWMKGQLQAYMRTQDLAKVAKSLDQLAEKARKGYVGWADSARAGAAAARAGDTAGVRAACKSCHDASRAQYRQELRTVQLF